MKIRVFMLLNFSRDDGTGRFFVHVSMNGSMDVMSAARSKIASKTLVDCGSLMTLGT